MRYARFVWGVALEDAPAKSSDGQCAILKIAPQMITNGNKMVETQGELEILNTGDAVSAGDEVGAVSDISGFWTRFAGGGGASGDYVTFQFVDEASVSASGSVLTESGSSSSSSSDDELPDDCESRIVSSGPYFGRVLNKACGMSSVPGETSDGFIELRDDIGIMDGRDYRDIIGRTGFAVRMQGQFEDSVSQPGSESIDLPCYWMIVIVSFWRIRSVVTDIIFGEESITIKRENLTVWDHCGLPDEIIEGTDCPLPGSGSSSESGSEDGGSGEPDPSPEIPLPPAP